MATQTALALIEIGKPLTKTTLPIPNSEDLEEHQVLIKVTAVGCKFQRTLTSLFCSF